jgi:hypothetical protein
MTSNTNTTCPQCGGLPHNHSTLALGSFEPFALDGGIYALQGAHDPDWRHEAEMTAANADGSHTLTCSDCDSHWHEFTGANGEPIAVPATRMRTSRFRSLTLGESGVVGITKILPPQYAG